MTMTRFSVFLSWVFILMPMTVKGHDVFHAHIYSHFNFRTKMEMKDLLIKSLDYRLGHRDHRISSTNYVTNWFIEIYEDDVYIARLNIPIMNHKNLLDICGHNTPVFLDDVNMSMMDVVQRFAQDNPRFRKKDYKLHESRTKEAFADINLTRELEKLGFDFAGFDGSFSDAIEQLGSYFTLFIKNNTGFENVEFVKHAQLKRDELVSLKLGDPVSKILMGEKLYFKMDGVSVTLILPFSTHADASAWSSKQNMLDNIVVNLFSAMADRVHGQNYFWDSKGFGSITATYIDKTVSDEGVEVVIDNNGGISTSYFKSSDNMTGDNCHAGFHRAYNEFMKENGLGPEHIKKTPLN